MSGGVAAYRSSTSTSNHFQLTSWTLSGMLRQRPSKPRQNGILKTVNIIKKKLVRTCPFDYYKVPINAIYQSPHTHISYIHVFRWFSIHTCSSSIIHCCSLCSTQHTHITFFFPEFQLRGPYYFSILYKLKFTLICQAEGCWPIRF